MIIFIYGQDSYRSRQKLNEIIEHYKKTHKSGLNLRHFDFKKDDYQNFKDQIFSISMFKEKKLAILENIIENKEFKEKFLEDAKKFTKLKDIILFYEEKEIPEKDKLLQFVAKFGKIQEFKLLEGRQLKNWVAKEITNLGKNLKIL